MQHLLLLALLSNLIVMPAAFGAAGSSPSSYDSLSSVQKDYWLKLLHYHKGVSRADGEKFFISPNGKIDPAAEFQADIDIFKDHNAHIGWFNYHPQCVFRERYEFIKAAGFLEGVRVEPCPELDEWKKGLNADSITLVFSSSYPNNPSSLFGHTLIRLNQRGKEKKSLGDLLDYAMAFSAMPEKEDIGVVFAGKGMFGGYKGLLEVTKYYTKVNEYNNGESRDLIEYDLKISPEELNRLINHLWEIYQTTYFDYYFTDENCSAVLSDILAVSFNLDDINTHQRWYYLPAEMTKTLKKAGRVVSENFRPSLKKQFERRLETLAADQILEMNKLAAGNSLPQDYDNIPVLDGLISFLDFTRYRTKDQLSTDQKVLMRKALLRRAALPQATEGKRIKDKDRDQDNRPDKGHEPQKFSFFIRTENAHSLIGFELKQGYHDLMSRDEGYDPFSQFDFFTGALVYDKNLNRVSYDKLTFVDLISLHAYKFYDPQFSWAAKITADRIYDLPCDLCHKVNARAYLGPTIRTHSKMAASLMAGIFGEASSHLRRGYRAGPGVEASFLYQFGKDFKIGLFDELRFDVTKKISDDYYNQLTGKFSYFSGINSEWRVESQLISRFKSFTKETWVNQLGFGFYF